MMHVEKQFPTTAGIIFAAEENCAAKKDMMHVAEQFLTTAGITHAVAGVGYGIFANHNIWLFNYK